MRMVLLLVMLAILMLEETVPFDPAFMEPITYSPKEMEKLEADMFVKKKLLTSYEKMIYALKKMMPDGSCKDMITKRGLAQVIRSANYRNWTVEGLTWLFNNYNCTSNGLMKIMKYAPWSWWKTLGEYTTDGKLFYKDMYTVTLHPTTKRYLVDYYFNYVETRKLRCNINQLLPLSWYKRLSARYWHWTIVQKHTAQMMNSVCKNAHNEMAVFNSKLVLTKLEVLKTYPFFVIKLYKHCTPELTKLWSVPEVLSWLLNCTKYDTDCFKAYCEMTVIACQLNCESRPCFRNLMIMSSKYYLTPTESVRVFRRMLEKNAIKTDLDEYYETFEKTIIAYLLSENIEKLDKSYERKSMNRSRIWTTTESPQDIAIREFAEDFKTYPNMSVDGRITDQELLQDTSYPLMETPVFSELDNPIDVHRQLRLPYIKRGGRLANWRNNRRLTGQDEDIYGVKKKKRTSNIDYEDDDDEDDYNGFDVSDSVDNRLTY